MAKIKHYGDITKINGAEVPAVDVITGGSPCQDLSVAGKRAGLAGERSGLFMEQIRIIKEMRNGKAGQLHGGRADESGRSCRFMVWENVYGAFSSNGGEDFRAVLEETARVADPNAVIPRLAPGQKWTSAGCIVGKGYSLAWRGHDAQHWGVPQRRKRICLLADFEGDAAGRILFETELWRTAPDGTPVEALGDFRAESRSEVQSFGEGLSGNPEQSGEEGERVTAVTEGCVGASSGVVSKGNGECFLTKEKHMSLSVGGGQAGQGYPCVMTEPVLLESNQNHATVQTDGISTALPAAMGEGGGYVPMIVNPQNPHAISFLERGGKPGGGKGILIQNEIVGALNIQCNQNVCCLNPWDVQSKHVQPRDGIAESLYSGECRYGGGESYVLDQVTVLNDQGGGVMNVSKDCVGTLRAQEHGHAPIVLKNTKGEQYGER